MRYIDADEHDLIARKDRVWSTDGTVERMIATLRSANRKVPRYLSSLNTNPPNQLRETATFAMHCYWEGESKLGSIEGVSSTRSGWVDSLEVVTLKYDPRQVAYSKLLDTAKSFECTSKIFAHSPEQLTIARQKFGEAAVALKNDSSIRDAKASDQNYYLIQTPLRHLPLSQMQATKINSALGLKQVVDPWISPRQRSLYRRILAAIERDQKALHSFQFPGDDSELAKYTIRLTERLNELEFESTTTK